MNINFLCIHDYKVVGIDKIKDEEYHFSIIKMRCCICGKLKSFRRLGMWTLAEINGSIKQ